MCDRVMKATLLFLGLIPCLFCAKLVQAQTNPGLRNTIQNSGSIPSTRLDTVRPVRQSNFIDSNSGSQQFFRGGEDSLYLLPAEDTKPILKIDDTSDIPETDRREINSVNSEEQLNHN